MEFKDYKKLYTELLLENKKLKLDLEAKRCFIDYMYEEVDVLCKAVDTVYYQADELEHAKNKLKTNLRESSTGIDAELENNKKKLK